MSLNQLRLVVVLGETGSLSRAAERVGLTQPAATRSLAALEQAVGATLFRRSRSGAAPTAAGHALIRHARRIEAVTAEASGEIAALEGGASAVVRVGTIVAGAVELVPRAIIETLKRLPGVRIQVRQAAQEVLLEALRHGDIDLAVARRVAPGSEDAFECFELLQENYCVVCDLQSRWARRRRLSLSELAGEPWVFPALGGPLTSALEALFERSQCKLPAHRVDSLSLQTSLTLVREGGYLFVMPRHLAAHYARLERVRILPLEAWFILGPITLYLRRAEEPAPAVRAMAEALCRAPRGLSG